MSLDDLDVLQEKNLECIDDDIDNDGISTNES